MEIIGYEDIKLSPSDALKIYTDKYPGTTVKEVDLELKSNSYLYEIEGYDEEKTYEIYVDPVNGTILETKEKLSKRIYKEINQEATDKIKEVVDKVLQETGPTSKLYKWSLEFEDGVLELDIRIRLESGENVDYRYNLATEEIIKKR